MRSPVKQSRSCCGPHGVMPAGERFAAWHGAWDWPRPGEAVPCELAVHKLPDQLPTVPRMSWNSGSCRGGGRATWTGQEPTPATTEDEQETTAASSTNEGGDR